MTVDWTSYPVIPANATACRHRTSIRELAPKERLRRTNAVFMEVAEERAAGLSVPSGEVAEGPWGLAVLSQPSTLLPDGEVELSVISVDAAGPRTGDAMQVRACSPWRFVAEPSLDCLGADALALEPNADGRIVLSTAQLLEAFPPPDGTMLDAASLAVAIEAGLQPRIPVIAEVELDGTTVIARRDLHIDNRDDLNNPVLVEVRFDGQATRTLRAGESHALTLEFAGFDSAPTGSSRARALRLLLRQPARQPEGARD
ncbi:MAG: hypothetical protein QM765_25630 [Myxococcales bacterium]